MRSRTRRRRPRRTRCRSCGGDNGKRPCPALRNILICPKCCREKRAKIPGCDSSCRYYAPLIVTSRRRPFTVPPLHECYMSQSEEAGMITAVVTRKRPDGYLMAFFVLLDLWKKGMRDCFMDVRVSEEELQERMRKLGEPHPLIQTKLENVQQVVKYALRIAREVGTEIPWEFHYWRWMLGDLRQVPDIGGSLYKCAKCGGDLPKQMVDLMKEHAQSDDIQFYILCRKCGGQFD